MNMILFEIMLVQNRLSVFDMFMILRIFMKKNYQIALLFWPNWSIYCSKKSQNCSSAAL